MAQDALNRWWWPCLMMFGPPDGRSPAHRPVDALEDQARSPTTSCGRNSSTRPCRRRDYLGLTIPDPALHVERGDAAHYDFGAIDWDEFRAVLAGNGPCNRERMEARARGA